MTRDAGGSIAAHALQDLAPALIAVLDPLKPTVAGPVTITDVEKIATGLRQRPRRPRLT